MDFQKKLQILFVKSNQNFFSDITKALENKDIKLAHRMVHTLKSSAAQLERTALRQIAADIDSQLKDGKNLVTKEQLDVLENELSVFLSELAPIVAETQTRTAVPTQPLDMEAARELMEKLAPMLEMGNPQCMKLIDELCQIPGSDKLIQQIEDFDFEPAAITLAELKEKLGIG